MMSANSAEKNPTIEEIVRTATQRTGDAQAVKKLAAHVLKTDSTGLVSRACEAFPKADYLLFKDAISRLEDGEPLYRIMGNREFHGLELVLNEATLEPRDDTEALIEAALAQIQNHSAELRFVDLGTGTGAIALALLSELPNARALLTDISAQALDGAQQNATALGFSDRVEFVQGDWLHPISDQFDFIVSNPPYIESAKINSLARQVKDYDPLAALDGGFDGLRAYRQILARAATCLKPDGFLGLEIGFDQLNSVSSLAESLGWTRINFTQDLGGNDRTIVFVQ